MILIWATTPLDSLSERREVEDGVLIRLAGLMRSNGGPLKALRAYNGEIDEDNADDFYRELADQTPAVLVSTSATRFSETSLNAKNTTGMLSVDILIASATLSGHIGRTRGDVATGAEDVVDYGDPGIYFMLAAIRRRLMGKALGIAEAGTLRPVSEEQLYSRQNHTAWRAVYRIPVRVRVARDDADDEGMFDELEHQHWNHDELADRDTLVATGIAIPTPD